MVLRGGGLQPLGGSEPTGGYKGTGLCMMVEVRYHSIDIVTYHNLDYVRDHGGIRVRQEHSTVENDGHTG